MPTGYTAAVADGKIATLREFALTCARGMGALVMMRDEPWDAPIPERFEPQLGYYAEELTKAQSTLDQLPMLSAAECLARSEAERRGSDEAAAKYNADKKAQRQRYETMARRVETWEGSPEGLKPFMLQQLYESIRFDCGDYVPDPHPIETGEEWRARILAKARKEVDYFEEKIAEEVARTEGRNAWVAQLRASLPADG